MKYRHINGRPVVKGALWTYEAGSSIPKATYSDPHLNWKHPNPIPLDSEGDAPPIWLGKGPYLVKVFAATGELILAVDNVEVEGV